VAAVLLVAQGLISLELNSKLVLTAKLLRDARLLTDNK
jgi:hypothetical protein